MFGKPSLMTRIAVGKLTGLFFGLIGLIFLPFFIEGVSWLFRWGILFWYTTFGAIIGVFGVFTYHPILKINFPWYLRGPFVGAWLNFVVTFLMYKEIEVMMVSMFGESGFFSSPFWLVAEGLVIGLIIEFLATHFGGEGKETI